MSLSKRFLNVNPRADHLWQAGAASQLDPDRTTLQGWLQDRVRVRRRTSPGDSLTKLFTTVIYEWA
jgi:hypothetical protein